MADKVQRIPLKPKTKKLIEGIVQGKTHRQAALDAGYGKGNPESASVLATRELSKVNVQEALQMALEEYGVTPHAVVKIVSDAMGATKTVILGQGDEAFADQVEDHGTRLKAAGLAARFMGIGNDNSGVTVQFNNFASERRTSYDLSQS